MKKVVVVINAYDEPQIKEIFEGEDLQVFNKWNDPKATLAFGRDKIPNILIVMDKGQNLAVFNKWHYWKKIE